MKNKPKILVIGSINMDLYLKISRVPFEGENLLGDEYRFIPGGKGANQAVAAVLQDADVTFVGKVGNENNGSELREILKNKGISTDYFK